MNFNKDNRQGMYKWYAEIFLLADIASRVIFGGGPNLCGPMRRIIFQDNGWFSEKPTQSLNYWGWWLQMLKIH